MPTETILNTAFNEAERMIYCRKRVLHTLDDMDPDEYSALLPEDIKSISIQEEQVCCQLEDTQLLIGKRFLIKNFWEHRTRIPSFFEYKIWNDYVTNTYKGAVPVGAIDYGKNIYRKPEIAVDKDGVQKLYYVNQKEQTCTCTAWQQLSANKDLFDNEFGKYSDIEFTPVCKHLSWMNALIKLRALQFMAKVKESKYNPNICVYKYDAQHRLMLYRVTNDGVKANAQWLPVKGWKEKHVYDASGMPTGDCWDTLQSALTGNPAYKLVPYSHTLTRALSKSGSR